MRSFLYKNEVVLALDVGLNLGWAYGDKKIMDHGIIKLAKNWGHDAAGRLYGLIHGFKHKFGIESVVHEKFGGRFYNSNKSLFGMQAIINLIYDDNEIDLVSPTTVKKFWFGSGRATKLDMLKITHMDYPDVFDDNESDAIAIWNWRKNVKN